MKFPWTGAKETLQKFQKTHQVLKRETSRVNPAWQVQTLEQELRGLRLSYEEHEISRYLQMACQEDESGKILSYHLIQYT